MDAPARVLFRRRQFEPANSTLRYHQMVWRGFILARAASTCAAEISRPSFSCRAAATTVATSVSGMGQPLFSASVRSVPKISRSVGGLRVVRTQIVSESSA